jgi:5-methylcytosine-specific restriction endonuclease McrA
MKGRTNHHSQQARQMFSKRWLGSGNPRWKGGVPRSVTHKNWLAAHPDRVRHYNRLGKARRRRAPGTYTLGEWLALKRAYLFTCPNPICLKSEPEIKLTPDHIVPLSRGGANRISNIQPLRQRCNTKKWATTQKFDSTGIVAKFKSTIAV